MTADTLAAALEREHHEIDGGIEEFLAEQEQGRITIEPLTRAMEALRRHIYLEEEFLFPPLREQLMAPIFVMLREHGEIWDTMDVVEAQLGADMDAESTSRICRLLLVQLARHNSKEEPVIYPHADTALTPAANANLRGFLESGELPVGWVCRQAGAQGTPGAGAISFSE